MLIKIILVLTILIAGFLIFVATRPAHFSITRSAVFPSSPDKVFPLVNDFHQWGEWSPWAKMDPNSKVTIGGPPSGVGATHAWSGNNEVGEGSMLITESRPNELIKLDLNFIKPMQAKNLTVFTFKPSGTGTEVTWTMSGENGFMGKLFGVIINCDKMVGGQFETGLANMKAVAEAKK
jgi:uncharacterized protein YndB with AHSA1/START domain